MKLRTRIIWISCSALILVSFVIQVITWYVVAEDKMDEAVSKAYQSYLSIYTTLMTQSSGTEVLESRDAYMEYVLKREGDDYSVCYRRENYSTGDITAVEIYNQTVVGYDELFYMDYTEYETARYSELDYKGREYLVFHGNMWGVYSIFQIYDITYVGEELLQLAGIMLLVMVIVTAVTILVLNLILRKEFRVLQRLSVTTEQMAAGNYDQRVVVERQDEIGTLGENFNRMAEAVKERTEYLIDAEQKKTLFMGNLTHELKTPMTAISGYAQTLLSAKLSEEDQQEALLYIYKECGRLNRLSGKMMKLLELDSSTELFFQEVSVAELFEDVKTICGKHLMEKEILLCIEEEGQKFNVDKDLMIDVLVNLLDNACKASENGQEIRLMAKENCIVVEDFGKGIPKEEQERILEPFYMIDKSRSRKSGGAGLGLALTALILKRHNAELRIESEVRKGSRFEIWF